MYVFIIYVSSAHDGDPSVKTEDDEKNGNTQNQNELPINCPQPSASIDRLLEITETENGEPQCPYCQYSNIATEAVKDHMNILHERRKWYGCPLCQLNTSCRSTIIHHLKKQHQLSTSDTFINTIQLSISENSEKNKKVF